MWPRALAARAAFDTYSNGAQVGPKLFWASTVPSSANITTPRSFALTCCTIPVRYLWNAVWFGVEGVRVIRQAGPRRRHLAGDHGISQLRAEQLVLQQSLREPDRFLTRPSSVLDSRFARLSPGSTDATGGRSKSYETGGQSAMQSTSIDRQAWRALRALAALLAALLALSACAGMGAPSATPQSGATATAAGPDATSGPDATGEANAVTISFAAPEPERSAYEPLIAAFNQQNSDVHVEFVPLPLEQAQSPDQLMRQLVSAADTGAAFF